MKPPSKWGQKHFSHISKMEARHIKIFPQVKGHPKGNIKKPPLCVLPVKSLI